MPWQQGSARIWSRCCATRPGWSISCTLMVSPASLPTSAGVMLFFSGRFVTFALLAVKRPEVTDHKANGRSKFTSACNVSFAL